MAATLPTFDVVILIDANGDYAVGKCNDTAVEAYEADIGSIGDSGGYRLVNLTVKAALPAPVELAAMIPADGSASVVLK